MNSSIALELERVSLTYRERHREKTALADLSLRIFRGEIFGFLGPNGAGKTTTIKSILNFLFPQKGKIFIFGRENRDPQVKSDIGYMPENADYYWYLSARELLRMYAGLFGFNRREAAQRAEKLIALVGLSPEADVLMKNYSKGMMQKVNLAQALINDPQILILDEPTGGLDPVARMNLRDIINDLKQQGKTIFFSSHELSEIEMVCDRIGILNRGRLIKIAAMPEIMREKGAGQSLENYFFKVISGDKP